jgi:predicted DCC family thiol-disulfide oxidoreductase YuxK
VTDIDTVLIYDGDCAYCSVAARALRSLPAVGAISWYDEAAQTFLDAQYGEIPFAMVLVDDAAGRVYAGRSAAEELADRAGTPGIVGALVGANYDRIADAVGRLSGRGRDPDDYHGVSRLAAPARERFADLAAAAATDAPDLSTGR